jgi:hypothetical protein
VSIYLCLFVGATCIHVYASDRKECYIPTTFQRGLSAIETWCKRWNIKVNEDTTQAIYFCRRIRRPEAHRTLNGRNIPFVNQVKYLGVIFDKSITWRLHIPVKMIEAKAFRTFIRIYFLFRSERLSAKIKLTLHKALIRSVMTYARIAWESEADTYLLKLQRLQNKVLRNIRNFPRRTQVRYLHMAFDLPCLCDRITKLFEQQAEVIKNNENEYVRSI